MVKETALSKQEVGKLDQLHQSITKEMHKSYGRALANPLRMARLLKRYEKAVEPYTCLPGHTHKFHGKAILYEFTGIVNGAFQRYTWTGNSTSLDIDRLINELHRPQLLQIRMYWPGKGKFAGTVFGVRGDGFYPEFAINDGACGLIIKDGGIHGARVKEDVKNMSTMYKWGLNTNGWDVAARVFGEYLDTRKPTFPVVPIDLTRFDNGRAV